MSEPIATTRAAATPTVAEGEGDYFRPGDYLPENSPGYLMRRIVASLAQNVELELASTGLTNAQWMPLYKLSRNGESTVAELARACMLDTGGMTRLLDRLEAKGLCRRTRSSEDRRVVKLALTPEGADAIRDVPTTLCRVTNAYLAGFSHSEIETLVSLLRRMLANTEPAPGCGASAN